jgi:hypothetical protein
MKSETMRTTIPAIKPSFGSSSFASLVAACAVLFAVLITASLVVAIVAEGGLSWRALAVAVVALAVCYVATGSSLVAVWVGNRSGLPVQGMLLGMLFRMGLPLAAIIIVGAQRTLGATIVVVYLLALVVETLLAVRMTSAKPRRSTDDTAPLTEAPITGAQPRPMVAN